MKTIILFIEFIQLLGVIMILTTAAWELKSKYNIPSQIAHVISLLVMIVTDAAECIALAVDGQSFIFEFMFCCTWTILLAIKAVSGIVNSFKAANNQKET